MQGGGGGGGERLARLCFPVPSLQSRLCVLMLRTYAAAEKLQGGDSANEFWG